MSLRYQLTCEGVRCFRKPQRVDIAPLTILVGENSSGKTTLLALNRIVWDAARGADGVFNDPPFFLGAFDQILSASRRKPEFQIGLSFSSRHSDRQFKVQSTWRDKDGQPGLVNWELSSDPVRLTLPPGQAGSFRVRNGDVDRTFAKTKTFLEQNHGPRELFEHLMAIGQARGLVPGWFIGESLDLTFELVLAFRPNSMAPFRSSPRRTYDFAGLPHGPEGDHVPMVLAQMAASSPAKWKELRAGLAAFGRAAGLFDGIQIERKGNKSSDPFQIKVSMKKGAANLIDVGYGVSQVLPIVVDVLRTKFDKGEYRRLTQMLLQQPEVHLHPRAQAALGTFFAQAVKTAGLHFMIETHSDHLIDRVRLAVRDGILTPADVSILYFERKANEATIHPLELDADGRIIDAPDSYRQFFLDEADRVLGV